MSLEVLRDKLLVRVKFRNILEHGIEEDVSVRTWGY
jgi:hypothetical protein